MEGEMTINGKRNGRVVLEFLPTLNESMLLNGVQACLRCVLENQDAEDWHHVQVCVEGDVIRRSEVTIDVVPHAGAMQVKDLRIEPTHEKMLSLTEAVPSQFVLTVTVDGEQVLHKAHQVMLQPYDQWAGVGVMPHLLASFVTPNHPALSAVSVEASTFLKKWTDSDSLDAYQTQDRNRVRFQVAAVYEALRSQGIVYSEPPASFERQGQRVRLADRVLQEKLGTCLDTTLLFASCLENIGIHPLLVIMRGHAFVGAWLTEQYYSQDVCDDSSYLLKESADGISNIVLVETTFITQSRSVSFDEAVAAADQKIHDENAFIMFVDVHRCRLDGIRPLPQRVMEDGKWSVVQDTTGREHATVEIKKQDHYALHLDNQETEVTKQIIWERKLLDFSLRNNLINCRLGRRVVPFVTFDMDAMEDNLHAGVDYSIVHYPQKQIEPTESGIYDSKLQASELRQMVSEEVKNNHHLISYLSESELASALKFIYRASRNSLEENGANTLFLAIGLLKWFENEKSVIPRYAPLLLMPVDIIRKTSNNYILRTRDEETILNITLVELLKQQFKINLSMLDVMPEDKEGIDVNIVLATIREAIKSISRWNVMEEALLGLFSFNKFVMWNDIHNNAELLKENDVVKSLMEGRVALKDTDSIIDAREIDRKGQPSDYSIPVDVDSSQLEAVVESGLGKSFILYGPPGTGKSQTITNMIANALYHDKRVLFVAEKMAALEVVQKRLAKIGLAPFCLELHSNKVTKAHFLSQMQEALNVVHIKEPEQYKNISDRLYAHRQQLIGYIEKLHKKQASGYSLYDCISRYLSIEGDEIKTLLPKASDINREKLERWVETTLDLEALFQIAGEPAGHPLSGLLPKSYQQDAVKQIERLLNQFKQQFQNLKAKAEALPLTIGLTDGELSWLTRLKSLKDLLPQTNMQQFVQLDVKAVQDEWQRVSDKWFLPRFFAKRSFMSEFCKPYNIGKSYDELAAQLDNQQQFVHALQDYCKSHNANYQEVLNLTMQPQTLERIDALAQQIESMKQLDKQFSEVAAFDLDDAVDPLTNKVSTYPAINAHADTWLAHLDQIKNWTLWTDCKQKLEKEEGLECLTTYIEQEGASPREAADALQKGVFHLLTMDIVEHDPELARFNGLLFEELVDKYKEETYAFQNLSKEELYCRLASRIPSQTVAATANSEMGILKRNISNGGRGTSIRKIIDQIPTLLPKLCPVMLMSPISVAQYIDMAGEKFDLVIFDEASQMPTSEAIGAIARGKALICVGDPKQMPPTSFFTTQQVDEDEVDIDDMESILDDCITLSMPGHYLSWHYRSKHESLIAFSNLEYYDGKLHTFPSVDDRTKKVRLVHVEGTYDKGRTRSNTAEAKAIVDEVIRRLSDPELSKRSIGIVSFSKVQQNLIEDILIEELAKHPELEKKAYTCEEPIFIKNLENVQGDERDIILFSVGYGPDKSGNVSMNFGPLNNDGGERRLNVAVSRARYEMIVFATLRPEQIDLKRSQAKGVEGLKKFLEFADRGTVITQSTSASQDPLVAQEQESDLVRLISEELRNNGYDVETMVGRSQFKIDIAVVNPDNEDEYMLGILCDGRNYYETKTTRDREIVQPNVLSGLHWNVMRVWAVDWYENRHQVISRILKRLDDIKHNVKQEELPSEAIKAQASKAFQVPEEAPQQPVNTRQKQYVTAMLDQTKLKFNEESTVLRQRVTERISRLLDKEQPIMNTLVYKRMAEYLGLTRAGQRVQEYLDVILMAHAYRDPRSDKDGDIYWKSASDADGYDSYRTGGNRDANDIPVIEAANAVVDIIQQNISVPMDELKRVTALQLGFTRRGAKVDALTERAVRLLLREQRIIDNSGMLTINEAAK